MGPESSFPVGKRGKTKGKWGIQKNEPIRCFGGGEDYVDDLKGRNRTMQLKGYVQKRI